MGQVAHSVACESLIRLMSDRGPAAALTLHHKHVHTSFERLHGGRRRMICMLLSKSGRMHLAHMLELLEACE